MNQAHALWACIFDRLLCSKDEIEVRRFSREHIFYSIVKYCEEQEDVIQRLDMFYYHDLIKKMVASIRDRRVAEAKYLAGQLAAFDMQLSSAVARNGMKALYYPAIALDNLSRGEYELACSNLHTSLSAIDKLYAGGCREAVFAAIEQRLNLFRLFAREGNMQKTVAAAIDVIDFLYAHRRNQLFMDVDLYQFCDQDDYVKIVGHYTDELLIKLCATGGGEYLRLFFENLIAKLDAWPQCDARTGFLLLACLISSEAGGGAVSVLPKIEELSFSLRYLISVAAMELHALEPEDPRRRFIETMAGRHPSYGRLNPNRADIVSALSVRRSKREHGASSAVADIGGGMVRSRSVSITPM